MPVCVVVTSDQHARSTVGLISPKGVALDDGGRYRPSKAQLWLWDHWRAAWERAVEEAHRAGAELWWVNNGDLVDGDHHHTYQIVSRNSIQEREIVRDILDVPLSYSPKHIFIVRGTETHTGPAASAEESIARALSDDWPVEWQSDPHTASWWHLMLEAEGVLLDFMHHGRVGWRPWTMAGQVGNLAAQIVFERANAGEPIPHIAVRSHYHRYADTGDLFRCRLIQTPAWQLATSYVRRVVPESLADIGLVWILIDDGTYRVGAYVTRPQRGEIWRVSTLRKKRR